MNSLTAKQERFCLEYMIDLNGTQAAIRAGYSKKTAREIAKENLTKPYLMAHLNGLMDQRAQELKIDAYWILGRFKDISDRCMQGDNPDYSAAIRATEMIGRHFGFFGKDNAQLYPKVNLSISNEELKAIVKRLDEIC